MFEDECTPLCPFRAFKCTRNALVIRRRRNRLDPLCEWSGDRCIGWRCQFADCMRHALRPDGTCNLVLMRKRVRKPPIDEEAVKMESKYAELGKKLKKLGVDVEGEV